MPEYIEKEALIEDLNQFAPEHYNALINKLITKQPAADVVAVVRCKDCVHFRVCIDRHGGVWMNCIREGHVPKVEAEHFCSYGERRGEDG